MTNRLSTASAIPVSRAMAARLWLLLRIASRNCSSMPLGVRLVVLFLAMSMLVVVMMVTAVAVMLTVVVTAVALTTLAMVLRAAPRTPGRHKPSAGSSPWLERSLRREYRLREASGSLLLARV